MPPNENEPTFKGMAPSRLLKYTPGEGTGPTKRDKLSPVIAGRVPSRGALGIAQQTTSLIVLGAVLSLGIVAMFLHRTSSHDAGKFDPRDPATQLVSGHGDISAGLFGNSPETNSLPGTDAWRSLTLGHYRQAISELQASAVPEPVIADIIRGAVARQFAPKLLALRRSPWRFWEPVQRQKSDTSEADAQREKQARQLETERNALVLDLLGTDWAAFESDVSGRPRPIDRLMDGLSASARSRSQDLIAEYDAAEREVIQRAGGTVGVPERAELNRLYAQKMIQLKERLSPQEIEEHELRTSATAENLRQLCLIGFDPSEEEFRAIYRVRKAFDGPLVELSNATNARLGLWHAQDQMEEQLREVLGDRRYADYCRSQDYTFRGLIELTDQFDLPKACAVQVHDLRETVLRDIRTLNQQSIPEQARKAFSDQIHRTARASVNRVLGDEAFRRYSQLDIAGWLEQGEGQ